MSVIWEYNIPTPAGPRRAFGCPVRVHLQDVGYVQVAYQFPGGGQRCAVVHQPSGRVLAWVTSRHQGHPQQIAQQAVTDGPICAADVWADLQKQDTLNIVPKVVGVLRYR